MPVQMLDLTITDMAQQMERLATNFGGKKDLELKADLWYDKLQRYPRTVVERVIDRLLSEDAKYFPNIGHALAIAKEIAPEFQRTTQSPKARMRLWEDDPWLGIVVTDDWRQDDLPSLPCPVCNSVIRFSPRGMVIVHADQIHKEARVSYSNMGRPEWFEMGPPPEPQTRKFLSRTPNPYPQLPPPAPLAEVVEAVAP